MPDFPTWVNDALASGQIEAKELDGWTGNAYTIQKLFKDADNETVQAWIDLGPACDGGTGWFLYIGRRECAVIQVDSPIHALRAANNLIAALESQPSPEVKRLQKRVGELEEAAKDYVAWLVERRDVPGSLRYLAFNSIGEPCWVDCADDACHFARKPDAMQWAEAETMELHVCDHQWSGGTPRDPVIQQYEWRKDDAN